MHITILSYTTGEERMLGTVSLDAIGKIRMTGRLPPGVVTVVQDAYLRAPSPEMFLRTLPQQFTGAYIRAVSVPD